MCSAIHQCRPFLGRCSPRFAWITSSTARFASALIPLFFSLCRDHEANAHEALAMNAIHPGQITADERITEIAEILAAGLMRLRARKSSPLSAHIGDSSLDCPGHQSGHANALTDNGGSE